MSPEQAGGDRLDHRTDLFSLGSVLYAITSGRPPFRAGNTLAVLKRVAEDTPRPIPEIIPETPDWLCQIIDKLLAKDRVQRFQTAEEVSAALEIMLADPVTGVPPNRPGAGPGPARRAFTRSRLNSWGSKALLTSGVLALAVVLTVPVYFLTRPRPRQGGPDSAGKDRDRIGGVVPSPVLPLPTPEELAARPGAADALDRSKIPLLLLAQAGAPGRLGGTPEQVPSALVAILGGVPFQHAKRPAGVSFSPDGKRLVTADGPLRIWDVASGRELFSLRNLDTGSLVCWSPDGKYLASGQGAEGKIWDLEKRQALHSLPGHDRNIRSLNFSPQSDRLATADGAGMVRIWNVPTGERIAAYKLNPYEMTDVVFDPTGTRLVTAPLGNPPRVWDAATGKELVKCQVPHPTDHHPSVSIRNDGKRVVTTCIDGRSAYVWNAETGRGELELKGSKGRLFRATYSPDGKLIATGGDIKDGVAVRLWNADTGVEIAPLRGPTKVIYQVVFSPDGKWLAATGDDDRPFVWDVATGLEQHPGHHGPVLAVAVSPDGKTLASAGTEADTRIRLWDLATGGLLRILSARPRPQVTLAFSPDGKILASGSENNGAITFWDWQAGRAADALSGQGRTVSQVAFSPDAEAEKLYLRSLAIREKLLGPNDPLVSESLNNIAVLYNAQGKYSQAEEYCLRAHHIKEQIYEPDHPRLATSYDNLATVCEHQGKNSEACLYYPKEIEICERKLGPDHPQTKNAKTGYENLLKKMNRGNG